MESSYILEGKNMLVSSGRRKGQDKGSTLEMKNLGAGHGRTNEHLKKAVGLSRSVLEAFRAKISSRTERVDV